MLKLSFSSGSSTAKSIVDASYLIAQSLCEWHRWDAACEREMKKQIFQQLSFNGNQFLCGLNGREGERMYLVAETDEKLEEKGELVASENTLVEFETFCHKFLQEMRHNLKLILIQRF